MTGEILLETWLAVADAAVLGAAAVGFALLRRIRPADSMDLKEAFEMLDRTIAKFLPDLSQGYTWEEAFERMREAGVRTDWEKVRGRLAAYEAYRYGGREEPKAGQEDVISLAVKLGSGLVGKGTKTKSA